MRIGRAAVGRLIGVASVGWLGADRVRAKKLPRGPRKAASQNARWKIESIQGAHTHTHTLTHSHTHTLTHSHTHTLTHSHTRHKFFVCGLAKHFLARCSRLPEEQSKRTLVPGLQFGQRKENGKPTQPWSIFFGDETPPASLPLITTSPVNYQVRTCLPKDRKATASASSSSTSTRYLHLGKGLA
ncbi:hypothetical protein V8C37DRAFT_218530 [Trichoderma ceciliae]